MAEKSIQRNPLGCYVYEIIVDGKVRYIGKGTGDRAWHHVRIAQKINRGRVTGAKVLWSTLYPKLAKAIVGGADIQTRVVVEGLSDADAYAREIVEISNASIGTLWNETRGGDGFSSEYQKKLWSDPIRVEKLRRLAIENWAANPEWRAARFAKSDAKAKQSAMVRAKWADPEYRAMQLAARAKAKGKTRKKNGFSKALSAAAKRRWSDPEFKERSTSAMKMALNRPDIREKLRAAAVRRWAEPGYRANRLKSKTREKEI